MVTRGIFTHTHRIAQPPTILRDGSGACLSLTTITISRRAPTPTKKGGAGETPAPPYDSDNCQTRNYPSRPLTASRSSESSAVVASIFS